MLPQVGIEPRPLVTSDKVHALHCVDLSSHDIVVAQI